MITHCFAVTRFSYAINNIPKIIHLMMRLCGFCGCTCSVVLEFPESSDEFLVPFKTLIVLAVDKDFLGVSEQPGDSGKTVTLK